MQGLDFQTWKLPFIGGLNQKTSPRLLSPPELTIATDVQYDKLGDLETRYPYSPLGSNIFGGGTISNARRIVRNGDELLLFTKDTLYSWDVQLSAWVSKGTHLAIKVDEQPQFVRTGDQMDCDRAELSNTIVYTWTELLGSSTRGYAAAIDKTTGLILMGPTALAASSSRLRVVALSTKIVLFFYDGSANLKAYALDPAAPATALAGAATTIVAGGAQFDVVKVPGLDKAVFASKVDSTHYNIGTVTSALVVTSSNKNRGNVSALAVAVTPDGVSAQVIRTAVPNVLGDLITISTLADVYTSQAIGLGSGGKRIAAAFRSVQNSGQYRCYVYWCGLDVTAPGSSYVRYNWVDTGNSLGTAADLVENCDIGSRAFDHDGSVYVNIVFDGVSTLGSGDGIVAKSALQNTYFLYRDDGFLCGKAAAGRAGPRSSEGFLPNVVETTSGVFTWCGIERRIIPIGSSSKAYADRGPRDITYTFDSNEARRCARLGNTLYITGAEILQYDGSQLTEVGFHLFPWYMTVSLTSGGSIDAGAYFDKIAYRWQNGRGDQERSTSPLVGSVTATGANKITTSVISPLNITHKTDAAIEVFRTLKNPSSDAPYYLITSKDPSATGDNGFVSNDTTNLNGYSVTDAFSDTTTGNLETNPENGAVLESLAPLAATIIIANDTRLFLAGVAGDPHRVWYSKQRGDGEVAAFHDALTIPVPAAGGTITGLAFLNDTLVVFRQTAVYVLPGDGYDNTGGGTNFGPARAVPGSIGAVSQESIVEIDSGLLFKSSKGWYLLDRGFELQYVGGGVMDYDSETPLAAGLVETQHHVRILTSARMLVFDTQGKQWFQWTINDGLDACVWNGVHHYLTTTGPKAQQISYATATYGMDVETSWIDLSAMQAFGRIRRLEVHGEYRAAHSLRIRLARDHWADGVDTYFDDHTWSPSPTTAGGPLELEHGPSIQQVNQLKVRITATPTTTGESLKLSYLLFELGFKQGLFRRLPQAQRQ